MCCLVTPAHTVCNNAYVALTVLQGRRAKVVGPLFFEGGGGGQGGARTRDHAGVLHFMTQTSMTNKAARRRKRYHPSLSASCTRLR